MSDDGKKTELRRSPRKNTNSSLDEVVTTTKTGKIAGIRKKITITEGESVNASNSQTISTRVTRSQCKKPVVLNPITIEEEDSENEENESEEQNKSGNKEDSKEIIEVKDSGNREITEEQDGENNTRNFVDEDTKITEENGSRNEEISKNNEDTSPTAVDSNTNSLNTTGNAGIREKITITEEELVNASNCQTISTRVTRSRCKNPVVVLNPITIEEENSENEGEDGKELNRSGNKEDGTRNDEENNKEIIEEKDSGNREITEEQDGENKEDNTRNFVDEDDKKITEEISKNNEDTSPTAVDSKTNSLSTTGESEVIASKIDDLLSTTYISDSDSEDDRNEFFDSMAEEGEEDTPSEGSNDIPVIGEEINTTESELSSDESYENNSFMDDEEEECVLLSGDEYDLSFEKKPKKSRIIQLDCESDDEIIRIPRKVEEVKKKKSRIIRVPDSSDEEEIVPSTERSSTPIKEPETVQPKPVYVNITMLIKGQKGTRQNTKIEDTKTAPLNEKIKNIIDSLSSEIDDASEISIKLSASHADTETEMISTNEKEQNISKKMKKKKKKKKNRGTKRKHELVNNEDSPETSQAISNNQKKKKKKSYRNKSEEESSKMGILDEVIALNESNNLFKADISSVSDDWEVQDIAIKPAQSTQKTDQNSKLKKFSSKDFKNSTLYEPSRVNRMDTKQLLKKKNIVLSYF